MTPAPPLRATATLFAGPTIWAVHFLAVYASESLICRLSSAGAHDVLVAAATVAALLGLGCLGMVVRRSSRTIESCRDIAAIAAALDSLSALAICLTTAAAAALPACY